MVGAAELSAEEYTTLELESWRNLHSYCLQYHIAENKPLGLFVDQKTGFKGIIKKANIEFPIKSDPLDDIIINSMFENRYDLSLVCCDDPSIEPSFAVLLKSVNLINQALTEDDLILFEACLLRGDETIIGVESIIDNSLILSSDPSSPNGEPLKHAFDSIFTKAPQLLEAISVAIRTMELLLKESNQDQSVLYSSSQAISPIYSHFLSSNRGINLLSESVRHMTRTKYNFCRDLLLFQSFVTKLRNKDNLEVIEKITSNTIPLTIELLNAFHLMTWICETPMTVGTGGPVGSDDCVAHLSILGLNEYINVNRSGATSAYLSLDCGPQTLLNHFIQNNGGVLAKRLLTHMAETSEETVANVEMWTTIIPQLVQAITLLISPLTNQFSLPEFLLGFGQYNLLMQYINKLDVWYEWNSRSRLFLKALCHLILGDAFKSIPLFNRALLGVSEEPFLHRFVGLNRVNEIEEDSDTIKADAIYKYYNKLLQLFAIYGTPDTIVEVVDSALSSLSKSEDIDYEQHITALYSTKFMAHLELGNTTEAYEALLSNPDISQRKICLRQFIVHHCDSGNLSALMAFAYKDIEDEFVSIIESRARSTDLLLSNEVNYYQLLYSYFVRDSNYRKAASVMYEYCRRLSQEVNGIESIQKQLSSYLIVLNCLKIINPKYSWIIKPTTRRDSSPQSKRKLNWSQTRTDSMEDSISSVEMEILDINDIKREYELVKARLRLLQKDEKAYEIANSLLGPTETVTVLISASLFDLAFNLCSLLKINYEPIFEGIVSKYIYLVQSGNSYEIVDVYDCFVDNETPLLGFINSANLAPVHKMWHLISAYLDKYEAPGQTALKKCVTQKLLSNGLMIPTCLKLKYQVSIELSFKHNIADITNITRQNK